MLFSMCIYGISPQKAWILSLDVSAYLCNVNHQVDTCMGLEYREDRMSSLAPSS